MPAEGVERRLAAILSADVVGYSRLMAEDEGATVDTVTEYREQVPKLVERHRGRVVDFTGDNFLAEFPTATDAVACAVEIQDVLRARNADVPTERRMEFRMGIHLGEVRVEGERIYGDGVNIAARREGFAKPGGLAVWSAGCDQVRRRAPPAVGERGRRRRKGFIGGRRPEDDNVDFRASDAGPRKRLHGRVGGEIRRHLTVRGDVALADSGPLDNPFIGSLDDLGEIVVGQNLFGKVRPPTLNDGPDHHQELATFCTGAPKLPR